MLLETGLKNKHEGFKAGVRADCSFIEQRMREKILESKPGRGDIVSLSSRCLSGLWLYPEVRL